MFSKSTWIVFLTIFFLPTLLQSTPIDNSGTNQETTEVKCNICAELKKDNINGNLGSLQETFEEDKKNVRKAFADIENDLNEINEKVWWLPKNDLAQLQNETDTLHDMVLKSTIGVKDIEAKAGDIRGKIEVYETEKETNKAKAVEQWGTLLAARHRLHNIEKVFLDALVLAEDLAAVAHMDRLRAFANIIARKLKEVIDYYEENSETVQGVYTKLHEIAVKKVEMQTKDLTPKKKKCFLFFFCD